MEGRDTVALLELSDSFSYFVDDTRDVISLVQRRDVWDPFGHFPVRYGVNQ